MEIGLKTLTPLWTGGADGAHDRLHETGIIGSLRWWYEAIIRGLGLYACDPGDEPCVYEEKSRLAGICHACQLFGCTGYSRRFRLVLDRLGNGGDPVTVRSKQSRNYADSLNDPKKKHNGWRIPTKSVGNLTLTFRPMRPDGLSDFERSAICYTVRLIEQYGALGAKTSHGQGVVRSDDRTNLTAVVEIDAWIRAAGAREAKSGSNLQSVPDLSDFIGATATVDAAATEKAGWWRAIPLTWPEALSPGNDLDWIASAPAIRAQLRGWLRNRGNFPDFGGDLRNDRHRIMGTIQKPIGPKGSDLFVTHLYKTGERWSMRIFGFVPREGNKIDRTMRRLLADQAALGREVSLALGGVGIRVDRYPKDVPALLTLERE